MGAAEHERMAVDDATRELRRALALSGAGVDGVMPKRLELASVGDSIRVPDWVRSLAVLVDESDTHWLVVTRREEAKDAGTGAESRHDEGGQFVLPLAGGRYLVETLDGETGRWVGRESAAGGPIVAGLLCPARIAVIRIVRIGSEDGR